MSTVPPVQGLPAPGVARSPEPQRQKAPVEPRPPEIRPVPEESAEKVLDALEQRGDRITVGARTAEFSYDRKLDRVIVKVYSSNTEPREVVRQIPPEAYLAFAARFRELLGILFDEKF